MGNACMNYAYIEHEDEAMLQQLANNIADYFSPELNRCYPGEPNIVDGVLEVYIGSNWKPPLEVYDQLQALDYDVKAGYFEPGNAFAGEYFCGDDSTVVGFEGITSPKAVRERMSRAGCEWVFDTLAREWYEEMADSIKEDMADNMAVSEDHFNQLMEKDFSEVEALYYSKHEEEVV